ncbi:MAG: lamin tail domain-containing protein [Myxococcota bacterium]
MLLLLALPALAHVPFPRGTMTITEVHAGPAADGGQWFEVRNNSTSGQNLVEQVFTDADGDTFQVTLIYIVRAGEYAVFASADSTVVADVTLPAGFDLRPDAGAVVHSDITGVVDEVVWDASWAVSSTSAHQLGLAVASNEWANDLSTNWCGGVGTPGVENEHCPGADTDDDGDGWSERDGDCDDTDAAVFPGAVDGPDAPDDGDCDGVRDEDVPVDTGGDSGDTAGDSGDSGDTAGDTGETDSGDTDSGDTDSGDTDSAEIDPVDSGDIPGDGPACAPGCGGSAAVLVWVGVLGACRRGRRVVP